MVKARRRLFIRALVEVYRYRSEEMIEDLMASVVALLRIHRNPARLQYVRSLSAPVHKTTDIFFEGQSQRADG